MWFLGNQFKINLQKWGGLWCWLTIRFSTPSSPKVTSRLSLPRHTTLLIWKQMWKLICVKLASWHFIKLHPKLILHSVIFGKCHLSQWHDLERYPAANNSQNAAAPGSQTAMILWQLLSSRPLNNTTVFVQFLCLFSPTSSINNSTNMSKTETQSILHTQLRPFLYDHSILGWPQRLFELSYNIF